MKRNLFFLLLTVSVIAILSFVSCKPAEQPSTAPSSDSSPAPSQPSKVEPIVWKVQSSYGSVTTCGAAGKAWAERLETITNGRLKGEFYEPNALCPIGETPSALGKGMIQASYQWGGYYGAKIPIGNIECGIPMLPVSESGIARHLWYDLGYLDLVREAYAKYDIYYLAPNFFPDPYSMGFSGNVKSLADVQGKKVRAVGIWGDMVQNLGGSPVSIPYAEIYTGLKLGTVDGAITCIISGLDEQKHMEVLKSYLLPNLYYLVDNVTISMDAWNSLPEDVKELVEESAVYHFADWENRTRWALINSEERAEQAGVQFSVLSQSETDTVADALMQAWYKQGEKDEYAARAIEMTSDILRQTGYIQ